MIAGRDNFAFCHGSRQGIYVSISIAAEMVYYKFLKRKREHGSTWLYKPRT